MAFQPRTFFVTGASGGQGGAVARQLLSAGHRVRALVRDPDKPSARALAGLGAALVPGDFGDPSALRRAAAGCEGVFVVTYPTFPDPTLELRHAANILDASRGAGVSRVVCSTVAGAGEHSSFRSWDPGNAPMTGYWVGKNAVQEAVRGAGFEGWCVLQPAWLMSNLVWPASQYYWPELQSQGVLLQGLGKETRLALAADGDVGRFAARALLGGEDMGGLRGQIVKIANEQLTIEECAHIVSEVSGVQLEVRYRSDEEVEELKYANPILAGQCWLRIDGPRVNIEEVKRHGVELTTLKGFLEENKERLMIALGR